MANYFYKVYKVWESIDLIIRTTFNNSFLINLRTIYFLTEIYICKVDIKKYETKGFHCTSVQ